LFFGEKLQKKALADEFEVNERTIQRDLSFLRYFVSVHSSILGNLVYNRDIKKYSIDRPSTIEKQEVLFISKILLENRALNKNEFKSNQKNEIYKGVISNINAFIYANPEYNFQKMKFIRKCLLKNLNYSEYINKHFNSNQYKQMNLGLDSDLDISLYAMPEFKAAITDMVQTYPWTFALALFAVSVVINSQAATAVMLLPVGIGLGIPAPILVGLMPATYAYFFIPNYPSDIATVNFDVTGTTKIGKYYFNHSFMVPGLIGVVVACLVGVSVAELVIR